MKRKVGLWVMCFCLAMALSACEKKTTEEPIVAESNFVTEEETKQILDFYQKLLYTMHK